MKKKLFIIFSIIILLLLLFFIFWFKPSSKTLKSPTSKENTVQKNDTTKNFTSTAFYLDYYPTSTYGQIIKHKYYTLSYSEKDEQAEWVAYKLTPSFLGKIKRANNFRKDPLVLTESANLKDYKASGYDRGHLAPAKSMSLNKTSMSESFFMSNMSPQKPGFNRGIWKNLESQVRKWVKNNDSLFVVSGPILDHPLNHIGQDKVSVPRAYYKTIVFYKNGVAKAIAFLLPNKKSKKSIFDYITSIDSVETVTGIDFYPKLNDSIENKIEANKDLKKI